VGTCAFIEQPASASFQDPLNLRVEGWFYGGDQHDAIQGIEVHLAGTLCGQTEILFGRKDVEDALGLPPETPTGFALLINVPTFLGQAGVRLECHALLRQGTRIFGAACEVSFVPHDHRNDHYGGLIRSDITQLLHRHDIYQTGPSASQINSECAALISRYLGPPPRRVLDVGCGLGGYGKTLLAQGYGWVGVEKSEADCVELARAGLPHERVDGETLPFQSLSFDDALCVEVLEHIADPDSFLEEIRRVIRRRLLISVPNLELLPYMHYMGAVPWHLLAGNHVNFFSRASLHHLAGRYFRRVEVLNYGMHRIRTAEGLPLYYHLFAVCDM
jgi:2-polyprenyl-3-methyl-5-hydroxy-6-metoxy-1,4-benzoquinol methylase